MHALNGVRLPVDLGSRVDDVVCRLLASQTLPRARGGHRALVLGGAADLEHLPIQEPVPSKAGGLALAGG